VNYGKATKTPLFTSHDGTAILPVYADYLAWSPQLATTLQSLAQQNRRSALHILGHAGPEVKQNARRLGVQVVEWPGRGL